MRKELIDLCKKHPDLKISFILYEWETDFLRFFQSMTNYNISKTSISLQTTIYKDKKSFTFTLKDPTIEQVIAKLEEAQIIVDKLPADPNFIDLEDNMEKSHEFDKINNIVKVGLENKIAILQKLADAVAEYKFKIFGTFICNYTTRYIINSNGLDKREINSPIYFECKAVSDENEVTILEVFGGEDFAKFDLEKFEKSIVRKVEAAQNEIVDVEAGEYDVILAPRCIGEYIDYLQNSMQCASLDNGQSFFEGKQGKLLFPKNITISDNPKDPELINFDYNADGHIYQNVPIIENGVFKNFMVGNYYGRKLKMKRNGANGSAMVMETGDKSLEEMIGSIKNGLYISSLHYMNFINPKETSVTGLTRDGTFLIEDGKITKVVNNLRFTEKISDVIEAIYQIENQAYTIPYSNNYGEFSIYSARMPHVAVKNFKISSSTKTI